MKRWLKSIKFSLSIIMAVVISAAMMIPAYATTSITDIICYGINFNTTDTYLYNQSASTTGGSNRTQAGQYVVMISGNFEENQIYTIGFEANLYPFDSNITDDVYIDDMFISNNKLTFLKPYNGQIITDYSANKYYEHFTDQREFTIITFSTYGIEITQEISYIYIVLQQMESNSIQQVTFDNIHIFQTDTESLSINNTIIESSNNLSNIINNGIDSIVDTIEDIDIESIVDSIMLIYNYGYNYTKIDSSLINNLGSVEDQLSNAEDALQNKSKSLVQRASGGVQQAVTASGQLVSSLTSTVPTVVSFATDIIDQTPDEVQAAVLAVPLLSFAAWLIGLKK